MKNLNSEKTVLRLAGVLLASSTIALPTLTQRAMAADPAIVQEAQQLCIDNAKTKGFDLKEVVSAGDADRLGKDAKIVLNLLKDGQEYKQTCYYDKNTKSVAFDAYQSPAPFATSSAALWWVLLPLIGLPLLLWWARKRELTVARSYTTKYSETVIHTTDGNPIQVYEDPAYSARVLRTVQDGQSVRITGRENEDWFELVGGGWLPKQYVRSSNRI